MVCYRDELNRILLKELETSLDSKISWWVASDWQICFIVAFATPHHIGKFNLIQMFYETPNTY